MFKHYINKIGNRTLVKIGSKAAQRESLTSGRITRAEWLRFMSNIVMNEPCLCTPETPHFHWLWQGKRIKNYGRFMWRGVGIYAHVFAWVALRGALAEGMVRDHLCKIKHCCNPACLEEVTSGENTRRGETTLAAQQLLQTHCKRGHLLDGDNLVPNGLRRGKRWCKICRNARSKESKQPLRQQARQERAKNAA